MILCVTRCEAFHLAGYRKVTYLYRTVLVVVRYGFVQEVDKMMHHVCQVKCKFKASSSAYESSDVSGKCVVNVNGRTEIKIPGMWPCQARLDNSYASPVGIRVCFVRSYLYMKTLPFASLM